MKKYKYKIVDYRQTTVIQNIEQRDLVNTVRLE